MFENIVERKIMWGDLDSLGIVFYPRYYEWIDASSHLYLEAIGLHSLKNWETRNLIFGLWETGCTYHETGRYHDLVKIASRITAMDAKSFTFNHIISRKIDDVVLVKGMERRLCMDSTDPKRIRAADIPEDIRLILKNAMG